MAVLRCEQCDTAIDLVGDQVSCACGKCLYSKIDGIYVRANSAVDQQDEMCVRDKQARGYLAHAKFPTHISVFDRWITEVESRSNAACQGPLESNHTRVALDLGCGPGPYTQRLQSLGYHVIAVDFQCNP
jgi:2-polyprenyl-3-methyl-5-hydroxy-6-metoxy-1,4-benzoquinol methylase